MKKLMIAACAVALAAMVQAGTVSWNSASLNYFYGGATTEKAAGSKLAIGTIAYLFDATTYSYETIGNDFLGAGIDTAKASDTFTMTTKGVVAGSWEGATPDQAYKFYVAIVQGDNLFVSSIVPADGPGSGKTTPLNWSATSESKVKALAIENGKGITGAGWYTAAPEPTSGLLLLLGVAGLALRRRRA